MPQDAFNLSRCTKELSPLLAHGKINRIIQPNKDEVSFYIYTGKTVLKLVLSTNASNARVCLTKTEKEAPLTAPNFCMLLRKHLLGGEILSIEQIGFERVIALTVHCVSDFTSCDRVLYAEIMGKYSNLILTENGVILGALKMTTLEENCKRLLLPGAAYTLPAPQNKISPLDQDALSSLLACCTGDMADFLFSHVSGIAASTARQIVAAYDGSVPFSDHVRAFLFEGENEPCVVMAQGVPTDFSAKRMAGGVPFPSVNEAQDAFFSAREAARDFEGKKRKLKNAVAGFVKKQEKNLARIRDKQAECANMEENRLKGELITSYIYLLKEGMESCALTNYYDEAGGTVKIALDKRLTPAQNAQKYYKKYNKQKRTLAALAPQQQKEEEELDYAESVLSFLDTAETPADLKEIEEELVSLGLVKPPQNAKKKKEAETPFREFEKDGFVILIGRNNVQNDRLLRRLAPNDIWLHVQKYHSSHAGIVTGGKKPPEEVLLYAAGLCAYYSQARNADKVPVDYCERKFVKKPPRARAGFVVYTDYKTVAVKPSL